MRIVILTDIPSPYQVELFNALARLDRWNVSIVYTRGSAKERAWQAIPTLHKHWFLDGPCWSEIVHEVIDCDLVVFGSYRPSKVARLIKARNRTGNAWVFWGERPGFHFPGQVLWSEPLEPNVGLSGAKYTHTASHRNRSPAICQGCQDGSGSLAATGRGYPSSIEPAN